jgi:dTDP-4-amino-4,6-dideoxygalactose transaminase
MFESYPELGFNYRLTDIQAAIGREQLKRLPEAITTRRKKVARYTQLFADIPGLILPAEPQWARSNWQSYCVRLPKHTNQVAAMQYMLDQGIATRRGIMCSHLEPAYHDPASWRCAQIGCRSRSGCPNLVESERAQSEGVILPLFSEMTEAQQHQVASALRQACSVRG